MNQPHEPPHREDRPPPVRRARLAVPDFGLSHAPVAVSLWLVAEGKQVTAGERVVELVAGAATIDLEAPLDGRLVAILRDEDDPVAPGEVLAEFEGLP